MAVRPISFSPMHQQLVDGPEAFFNQPDYVRRTTAEMASKTALPVAYTWNTESRAKRIAKIVLAIVIFPIGIYRLLHGLAGFAILPSAAMSLDENVRQQMHRYRSAVRIDPAQSGGWRYKRLTIEVDGYKIDAVIMGKAQNLSNGRWVVSAGGNGEFYEHELVSGRAADIANEIDANVLVFNYAGTMCSSGALPTRKAMEKSMRAMVQFLEDKEKGVGAQELILVGHSIGGGVLADTLENHTFDPSTRKVAVYSRTFNDLSTAASTLVFKVAGVAVKILGWNFNPARAAKRPICPQLILQTGRADAFQSNRVGDDGIITQKASLAQRLLEGTTRESEDVMLIGERHNDMLYPSTVRRVGDSVNAKLNAQQDAAAAA